MEHAWDLLLGSPYKETPRCWILGIPREVAGVWESGDQHPCFCYMPSGCPPELSPHSASSSSTSITGKSCSFHRKGRMHEEEYLLLQLPRRVTYMLTVQTHANRCCEFEVMLIEKVSLMKVYYLQNYQKGAHYYHLLPWLRFEQNRSPEALKQQWEQPHMHFSQNTNLWEVVDLSSSETGLVPLVLLIWTLATITSNDGEKVWDFLASQALNTTQSPSCGFLLSPRWLKVRCCKNLLGKYRTGCQLLTLPVHSSELIFWPLGQVKKSKVLISPLFTQTNKILKQHGKDQNKRRTIWLHWVTG